MLLDTGPLHSLHDSLLREDFGFFCEAALKPLGQKPAAHHVVVIKKLQAVAEGKIKRLMLLMPPGSAKSTYASQLFPAWYMSRANRMLFAASNTAGLATEFSAKAQRFAHNHSRQLGYSLTKTTEDKWYASNGSEYRCFGTGAKIAGRRADVALIDDPFGGRADVNSESTRDKVWNWYRGDVAGRMKPGGSIVLINTHWHEDDLTGRLKAAGKAGGQRWDIVLMQAIYDGEVDDPINRHVGEALWPEWEDVEALTVKRQEMGEIEWFSQFQQNPRVAGGSLFKMKMLPPLLSAAPAGGHVVRGWDLAATAQVGTANPDWTVGVKLARYPDGSFVVLDVFRDRGGPDDVKRWIVNTAAQDGKGCRVGLPQDPGQAGKAQILDLTRALAGYRVESSPESGEKSTRAAPVASQFNVGNLSIAGLDAYGEKLPWVQKFLDELAMFPGAAKDDQVDALSRAFSMVGLARPPMRIDPAEAARF